MVRFCRGPHMITQNKLENFKLMKVAGLIGGDSNNKYYTYLWNCGSEKELEGNHLEEAEKRDHRKLGKK